MIWLYKKANGEAKLFKRDEAEEALNLEEWTETPATCNCNYSCEGEGIGDIAIENYQGLTVEDFKSRFTLEELKVIGKRLNISLKGKRNEDQVAKALVEALTK